MLNSTPLPHTINGKLRDELLDGEIFYTLKEAQITTGLILAILLSLNYRERTKKEEKKTLIQ